MTSTASSNRGRSLHASSVARLHRNSNKHFHPRASLFCAFRQAFKSEPSSSLFLILFSIPIRNLISIPILIVFRSRITRQHLTRSRLSPRLPQRLHRETNGSGKSHLHSCSCCPLRAVVAVEPRPARRSASALCCTSARCSACASHRPAWLLSNETL